MDDLLCESRVVVVLNKVSEERCVDTIGFYGVDHVVQIADAAAGRLKGVEQLPVAAWYPPLVNQSKLPDAQMSTYIG